MKSNRRQFLLGASAALLSGCAVRFFPIRPYLQTSNLAVSDEKNIPFTIKSQAEGEKDLERLVFSAKQEDAWIFLNKEEESVWYDIGIMQERNKAKLDVHVISQLVWQVIEEHKERESLFVNYHIHPYTAVIGSLKGITKQLLKGWSDPEEYKKLESSGFKGVKMSVSQAGLEVCSLPSPEDMAAHIRLEKGLKKKGCRFGSSKVIVPTGSFSYSPSPSLVEEYEHRGIRKLQEIYDQGYIEGLEENCLEIAITHLGKSGWNIDYQKTKEFAGPLILDL